MIDGKPFDWLATPELGRCDNSYPIARKSDSGVASRRYNLEHDGDRQAEKDLTHLDRRKS